MPPKTSVICWRELASPPLEIQSPRWVLLTILCERMADYLPYSPFVKEGRGVSRSRSGHCDVKFGDEGLVYYFLKILFH